MSPTNRSVTSNRASAGAVVLRGRRAPHRLRTLFGAASALITLAVLVPQVAFAHAELDTVTPADTSAVQGSPTEIVMTFTQHLDPARSNIRLVDAGGTVIDEGSTVDADRTTMRLAIASPLGAGVYTTRWTSFSADDGEQDHGTTTFTVVAAAPSERPSVVPSTSGLSASAGTPSVAPSILASAAPSSPPLTPAASTGDVIIPIAVVLVVLAGLGAWLLRGRARVR